MRATKEIAFLVLVALVGAFAGGWCAHLFGVKPTGVLLKYGGLIVSGFLFAARLLNTAFANTDQLAQFDERTRCDFAIALQTFKRRFNRRFLLGLALGAVSVATGVILSEATALPVGRGLLLACLGGVGLVVGGVMVGGQLLAASWPAEFLASAKQIARDEQTRAARLAAYSRDDQPRTLL